MTESHFTILAFLNLPSGAEWVIVLIIALLIFGKRLPDVARSLGKSLGSFKKGIHDAQDEIEDDQKEEENPSDDNPYKS